jgi:hypothetical protein
MPTADSKTYISVRAVIHISNLFMCIISVRIGSQILRCFTQSSPFLFFTKNTVAEFHISCADRACMCCSDVKLIIAQEEILSPCFSRRCSCRRWLIRGSFASSRIEFLACHTAEAAFVKWKTHFESVYMSLPRQLNHTALSHFTQNQSKNP